jgi:hypothetical protein
MANPIAGLTICDVRTLSVAIVRPFDNLFYNWTTSGWENPFVPANHLKPLASMQPAPSPFSVVKSLDLGEVFLDRNDVAALVMLADGSQVIDEYTLPAPARVPSIGGFMR